MKDANSEKQLTASCFKTCKSTTLEQTIGHADSRERQSAAQPVS